MVHLSATRCSCIAILWVSLVSFATITLCVAQQVFIVVVVYSVIDSVWKLSDTPSYILKLPLRDWKDMQTICHAMLYAVTEDRCNIPLLTLLPAIQHPRIWYTKSTNISNAAQSTNGSSPIQILLAGHVLSQTWCHNNHIFSYGW
jgi:hypothetical protein